jgi:hypothetical protein
MMSMSRTTFNTSNSSVKYTTQRLMKYLRKNDFSISMRTTAVMLKTTIQCVYVSFGAFTAMKQLQEKQGLTIIIIT